MKKENLDTKISFRLSKSDGELWREKAKESDLNLGDWIRAQIKLDGVDPVLTKKKTPRRGKPKKFTPVDPALIAGVGRVGNNLNQVARWANTHKDKADAVQIIAHLIEIREAVERLVHAD